jgi:DNA-binding HxlR family transcriptional regulator
MRKLSVQDVLTVLDDQRTSKEAFGAVAERLGLLTAREVEELLQEQRRQTTRIGELLVKMGAILPETLDRELRTLGVPSDGKAPL